jgi:hypothetical protein
MLLQMIIPYVIVVWREKKTVFQVSAGTKLLSAICLEEQIRERVVLFLFCLVAAGSLPRSLR